MHLKHQNKRYSNVIILKYFFQTNKRKEKRNTTKITGKKKKYKIYLRLSMQYI